jgi:hypothetical protein
VGRESRCTFEGLDVGWVEGDGVGGVFDVEARGVPGDVFLSRHKSLLVMFYLIH